MRIRLSHLGPAAQPRPEAESVEKRPKAVHRAVASKSARRGQSSYLSLPETSIGAGQGSVRILLDSSMLQSLETLTRESTGGAEIGGLLLGRHIKGRESGLLIEGYVGLSWDESAGGAPRLQPRQLSMLQQKLATWRSRKPNDLHAVGYYRTCGGGELELLDADRKLQAEHFDQPLDVALLIQATPTTNTIGVLYYGFGGGANGETSSYEFLFDDSSSFLPATRSAGKSARLLNWVKLQWKNAAVAGLIVVAAVLYRSEPNEQKPAPPVAATPVAPSLELRVTRMGNELHVGWNKASQVITTASQGFLSITDGGVNKLIPLDRPQLLGAQFLYSPMSGDVSIRLEVFTDAQERHAEAVRVYAAAPLPPSGESSPAGGWQNPNAYLLGSLGANRTAPADSIREAITRAPWQPELPLPGRTDGFAPEASAPAPEALLPRRPMQLFTPGLESWLAPPKIDTTVNVAHPPQATASASLPEPPLASPPPTSSPAATSGPAASGVATSSAASSGVDPLPAAAKEAPTIRTQTTEPEAIQVAPPALGRDLRRMVPKGATITIRVRVSAQGRVLNAEAVPREQPGILGYVTALSVNNARNWRFKPATQDGAPAASEATIRLKF